MNEKVQYKKMFEPVIVNFVWGMIQEVGGKKVYVMNEEGEMLFVDGSMVERCNDEFFCIKELI